MTTHHFVIQFHNEVQHLGRAVEQQLKSQAEQRLYQLAATRRILIGATVTIEQPLQRPVAHLYTVQVAVVDAKHKKHVLATRATSVEVALQQTLTLLERQLALHFPSPKPLLIRVWHMIGHYPIGQLWEELVSRCRRIRLA